MKTIYTALILLFAIACNTKVKTSEPSYVLEKAWETDTLLTTSESAIYDAESNAIYVSCINKNPREKDGNGFISKVSTAGVIVEAQWIKGMHGPKGLGLYQNKLFIADIDEVIVVDISEGEISERIVIDSAIMLNDISVDSSGKIYVSDTGGNKIYTISNGNVSLLVDKGLASPNGLLVEQECLLLASMGSMDLVSFNLKTMEKTLVVDSINKGDGIVKIDEQTYIVSDWFGELFLVDSQNNKTSILNTKALNIGSADLGFVPDLSLVLVPTFNTNTLVAYTLSQK